MVQVSTLKKKKSMRVRSSIVIASSIQTQTISKLYGYFMWFISWFRENIGLLLSSLMLFIVQALQRQHVLPSLLLFCWSEGISCVLLGPECVSHRSRMLMSSINKSTVQESESSQEQQGSSSMWSVDDQKNYDTTDTFLTEDTHTYTTKRKREKWRKGSGRDCFLFAINWKKC